MVTILSLNDYRLPVFKSEKHLYLFILKSRLSSERQASS
jgi:hypothetical protein